jgi:hypothetical protein
MRLVQNAVRLPHRCAVVPFIGQNHAEGFIDTECDLDGLRVYISVVAFRDIAKLLRYVPASAVVAAEDRVAALQAELAQARAELAQAELHLDAVDLLESRGFTARKKPGRPKKEEVTA